MGLQIRSITLVEKCSSVGPGLAYSKACAGTVLNMHGNTTGLYAEGPTHLSTWMKSRHPNLDAEPFPTRVLYGEYLAELIDYVAK